MLTFSGPPDSPPPPQQRLLWPQISVVSRLRKPGLEGVTYLQVRDAVFWIFFERDVQSAMEMIGSDPALDRT